MPAIPAIINRSAPVLGPTSTGTAGYALLSDGNGASDWGNVTVDLSAYATTAYVDAAVGAIDLSGYVTDGELTTALADYATTNASSLTSGTLADARLSTKVPLKDVANTFTTTQTITGNGTDRYMTFSRSGQTSYLAANNDLVNFRSLWVNIDAGAVPSGGIIAVQGEFRAYVAGSLAAIFAAATSANSTITGSVSGDLCLRSQSGDILFGYGPKLTSRVVGATSVATYYLDSSTGTRRETHSVSPSWAEATDATRKARVTHSVYDTAARECMRHETDGSRGYAIPSCHTTAPADSMLPNNGICFYMDSGTLKAKYKDGSGVVSTLTLS